MWQHIRHVWKLAIGSACSADSAHASELICIFIAIFLYNGCYSLIYKHFADQQHYLSWHSHSCKLLTALEKQGLRNFEHLLLVTCERNWIRFAEVIEVLVPLETEQNPDQITISISNCQLVKLNTHFKKL